ncbi:family 78 glycoside hydrolase catalytic domain [Paenibacillus oceani]|uniref:Family 78 glycoside hydrolase catalytic domain n=1 Tax=Paenibacillus oceani TaxID=2772510 RepID=A0A927C868_9BACL|nr:family 78 glycoside hydrolase catalytic domain [Paenibacillus oceani]MBD2862965.1 family 78 glycoside hydrolase catalytic domain [Paenibacillus oceani]
MKPNADWKASWIWSGGDTSPRNEWRCFRKQFTLPSADAGRPVQLKITADSRYVLYVNGTAAGRGPVRSWPFELAYDEYEIGHLLRPGTDNTIAVLVTHYGVPTFQYVRGRGGLLAQVELSGEGERTVLAATDASWTTSLHAGYDSRSPRISCQLPFTEVYDAAGCDASWSDAGFDDSGWENVSVIGPVGMEPWTQLVERDIPHLTEEPVYPVRVESLSRVKPRSWGVVLDLRNHFVPSSEHHANNVRLYGFLATVIRTDKAVRATIGIVDSGRLPGSCSINGIWYPDTAYYGEKPRRFLDVELQQGDNFLMLALKGTIHGHSFHFGIDCEEPFEVVSPLADAAGTNADSRSSFATLGPFDHIEIIDHQPARPLNESHPDYDRARAISSAAGLHEFPEWLRPVDNRYVSKDDVFSQCIWTTQSVRLPVPYSLHQAVIANRSAAVVPVYPGEDTEMIIDFGKEYTGYIEFEAEASAGTTLDFYGLEFIQDGWRQDTFELDNTMRYVCREGRQSYSSPIRRGFRYLMVVVRNTAAPVQFHRISMLQSNFAVAEIGRFRSSDALLNDIWEISKHTTRVCMEDTFVDCPAYEQAFWVGDARNEALVNYYVFGDDAIVKRCLRLVPGSQFQTPLYADQVPSGWNSVIPNWTFFWAIACLELYEFSGDRSFAEQIWPQVRSTLDHFAEKLDDRGLLYMKAWNLLDWAPIDQPRDGVVTHQNLFFVKALRSASRIAADTDPAGAARLLARADALKTAINAHLWSEERNAFVDCIHSDGRISRVFSMQTQVVAYLCDIAEGERQRILENYVAEPPVEFVQIGSPFMSFFYHEALAKLGRIDIMLDDIRTQYGHMIEHDATTCWEMYPRPLERRNHPNELTRSHCHAWSAGPGYFLGAYILGVRGLNPGWTKIAVEPNIADLTWATGTVPLPGLGRIDITWHVDRANRKLRLRVETPLGRELSITAPVGYELELERIELGS